MEKSGHGPGLANNDRYVLMLKKVSMPLIAIGSILLFFSWLAQNYFEKKWENEYRLNQAASDFIVHETYMCDIFLMEHSRLHDEKPVNMKALAANSIKLSFTMANIMYTSDAIAAAVVKIPNPSSSLNPSELLKKMAALDTDHKYEEIVVEAHKVKAKYDQEWKIPEVIDARGTLAYLKANDWNDKFLKLYILGSILISLGWICGKVRSDHVDAQAKDHEVQPKIRISKQANKKTK